MADHDALVAVVVPFGSPHFGTQTLLVEVVAANIDAIVSPVLGAIVRELLQHRTSIFTVLYTQICVTVLLEDLEECGTDGGPYK